MATQSCCFVNECNRSFLRFGANVTVSVFLCVFAVRRREEVVDILTTIGVGFLDWCVNVNEVDVLEKAIGPSFSQIVGNRGSVVGGRWT